MPVKRCKSGDKEGRKWGDAGKCYPCKKTDSGWDCKQATQKALAQARAMGELENIEESDEELSDIIENSLKMDKNMNIWSGKLDGRQYETTEILYKGVELYGCE